ncbi:MAG: DMT family transporter [Propionibacteriaceae bacterium]|jgi:DME family drug/metabolite transporter|nr:DMT family transporter [Propionibacteriaceae bacterium]
MKYALLVLAGAVLYGTTGTSQAFAPDGASSMSIGSARLAFGGLIMGTLGCISWWRRRATLTQLSWREALAITIGAGVVLIYQSTFFAATRVNGVMVGTVIALGSSPVFTGLIEWVVLKTRPSLRWMLATVLAVVGVAALSWSTGSRVQVDPWGVILALISGACYATLAVATKWLLNRGWRSTDVAMAVMGVGSLPAFLILSMSDSSWLATPRGIAVTSWMAIATLCIAYMLTVAGMRGMTAASTTTVGLAEPATATLLGVVVLSEPLTLTRVLGLAAIIGGVVVLGLTKASSTTQVPQDS